MRIRDIVGFLKEYLFLGVFVLLFFGILFLLGYKFIYKKMLKGKKEIEKKKLFLYGVSICYAMIVFGSVFLNRGKLYGVINLHLFSSYKEAYYSMEIVLFRNIVLNILLFVPLGFLLPFFGDKLKKVYTVVPIGFLVTLSIEIVQYVTKLGIFEIDDIFNNTVGVLLGYSIFGFFYSLRKRKGKCIIKYTIPILFVVFVFGGIYITYQKQEFGNLSYENFTKINMQNVKIEKDVTMAKERSRQEIYYKKSLKEAETRAFAEAFFEKLGTKLSEKETDIYDYSAFYYSLGREHHISIDYKDGTYSYADYSYLETNKEEKKASREELERAFENLGIKISKDAEFSENASSYVFSVNLEKQGNDLVDGEIICFHYQDGKIKQMKNNLITYEKVKEKEIISEEEAFQKIVEGKFFYNHWYGKISSIRIEAVELKYDLDSKGYYVPVYQFKVKINNQDTVILIKAIE